MTSPSSSQPTKRKRLVKTASLKRKQNNVVSSKYESKKVRYLGENDDNIGEHSEQVCTICLSSVSYPKAVPNHCKHEFCNKCIFLWKERSNHCPVCRSKFTSLKVFESKESNTFKVVSAKKKDFEVEKLNENSDEEEAEEYRYYPNDEEEEEEEEEEEDDASDADEHGNLAGFVVEEDKKIADDESFVLNEEELEEEDNELSQISLVDETEIHTPEKSFINLATPISQSNKVIYIDSTPLKHIVEIGELSESDDDVTEVLDPNEIREIIEIL